MSLGRAKYIIKYYGLQGMSKMDLRGLLNGNPREIPELKTAIKTYIKGGAY